MPEFPVSPEKAKALEERLAALGIREADLQESFVRSGGPGGQNVNKVSTCVVLSHRPSGLTVRCQQERSQALNRYLARKLLADKLEEKVQGAASARQQAFEKIRRQKRKRSRRAKDRMLDAKYRRGRIKASRRSGFGTD
jgi:protein subunit release factor B